MYKEIYGNLITMANNFEFDVIAHGCNCMCTMKRGLAPEMVRAFHVDMYPLEQPIYKGDVNKLGQIDYSFLNSVDKEVAVVNCYTQYMWSTPDNPQPLDYDALRLCMRKINHKFKGKHIGLPLIGCSLAGGDWSIVSKIIQEEFTKCDVTIVKLKT